MDQTVLTLLVTVHTGICAVALLSLNILIDEKKFFLLSTTSPEHVIHKNYPKFEDDNLAIVSSKSEQEALDNLADLYAIIITTEHLERAYSRDAISHTEYTVECNKLITQFRLTERVALKEPLTTEKFMSLYEIDCPRAYDRLCRKGVPEPIKSSHDIDHKKVALLVKEVTAQFITSMDLLELERRAVDEIQPQLTCLMDALNRLPDTPKDFEPNRLVLGWLEKLTIMRAVENITDDDARQLLLDLDKSYTAFNRYLERSD